MLKARIEKHNLIFRFPAGKSWGVLHEHNAFYLILSSSDDKSIGIGECSPLLV